MFRRFSVNFAVFSILLDLALILGALITASQLRSALSVLPFVKEIPKIPLPGVLYILFPLVWVGILLAFSVYDGRKNLRVVDELSSLTMASLLAVMSLAGILYFSYRDVSRFLFLSATGSAYFVLVGWRLVARMIFRRNGLHRTIRRVLILGDNAVGRQLEEQIRAHPFLGLEIVGFLDDNWQKQADHADVLGSLDAVRIWVQKKAVDDVVVALPLAAHQRLTEVVSELHDLPVRVWIIPDYFSLTLYRARVEDFAGIPMLDLRAPALSEFQRLVKRLFDLTISTLILPLVLPLMGIIALAIKLDSPGPVLYRARRVGENGKLFWMLKFRTMVQDADKRLHEVMQTDEQGNLIYKRPDDPRVTRVGRFLRRTSLDELPQLFNVLRGEMSLVGPRPEIPELVERYALWQRKRFAVPQGITGWWQINGRADKPMHLHTEDDLYYVQNYSIWLDLLILWRTFWAVLRRKGAF